MFTRIKAEREKRGMEQKELAARIGIAVPTLGNYEAGRRERAETRPRRSRERFYRLL